MSDKYDLNAQAEEKKEFDIVEIKEWREKNTGMTLIEEISSGNGMYPEPSSTYYGQAQVMTNMGPIGIKFVFPDSYSVPDCFEHFEEYAEKAVAQMRKEQEQQIVIPNGINPQDLRA